MTEACLGRFRGRERIKCGAVSHNHMPFVRFKCSLRHSLQGTLVLHTVAELSSIKSSTGQYSTWKPLYVQCVRAAVLLHPGVLELSALLRSGKDAAD